MRLAVRSPGSARIEKGLRDWCDCGAGLTTGRLGLRLLFRAQLRPLRARLWRFHGRLCRARRHATTYACHCGRPDGHTAPSRQGPDAPAAAASNWPANENSDRQPDCRANAQPSRPNAPRTSQHVTLSIWAAARIVALPIGAGPCRRNATSSRRCDCCLTVAPQSSIRSGRSSQEAQSASSAASSAAVFDRTKRRPIEIDERGAHWQRRVKRSQSFAIQCELNDMSGRRPHRRRRRV